MSQNPTRLPKILLVEDHDQVRETIKIELEVMYGCLIVEAADGRSAVEMARQHRPDLIIMDMHLPELDGFEATRLIHAQPETQHVPVVALSGYGWDFDWEERALAVGCVECLRKPVTYEALYDLLQRRLPDG
jgi:CheY-like chemotaxis protein